ncbi:tyrosine-type recombinase/integrase (plasmid) [Aliarcobacter lanthieri]|uniref:tyrosine-type recombinase/integrase n=1 Tax=Aliarcobacter lanthieri TaxID=1355374 RepID=UPI003AAEFCEF
MSIVGTPIFFTEDVLEFEPYEDFNDNYMHWFIPYMLNVFQNQSKRKIKDPIIHKQLIKKFATFKNFDDMRIVINDLAKNGFKGPKTYFNPNKSFYEFLLSYNINSLSQINSNMLKHYLSEELEGYSYISKKNIYVALKNFLTYIESKNFLKNEPTKTGHNFKLHKDIIKVIGKEKKKFAYLNPYDEYNRFLEAIDNVEWKGKTKHRNRLILKILLLTGIRVGELIDIKKKDLIISENNNKVEFNIIGKGNKKRLVSIALSLISRDFKPYMNEIIDNSEYLFSSSTGKQLNDRYIRTLVEKTREAAHIPKKDKDGPHVLRHSLCSYLSAVGNFDIAKIQHFMAHEDISTTKKYLHLDDQVIEDVKNKTVELLDEVINKI